MSAEDGKLRDRPERAPGRPDQPAGLGSFRSKWKALRRRVEGVRSLGAYTFLEPSTFGRRATLELNGRRMINLASNDYLGLALHPKVVEGAVRAARRYGAGAASSPLLSGQTPLHAELEERLADITGQERAMLFPSGYQGNLAVISTLLGPGDDVYLDRLDHASIVDGATLSQARIWLFPHGDLDRLESRLRGSTGARRLIALESVYSMDGDEADLVRVCEIAERRDAMVMVDEAHSFGMLPPDGAGAVVAQGVADRVGLVYGTLSKAVGSQGAFVAGRRELVDFLQHASRGYIFSTAPAPAVVGAALAALDVIAAEPERIEHLRAITERMHRGLRERGFDTGRSTTPITPILSSGGSVAVVRMNLALRRRGVCAQVIVFPAVQADQQRLRANLRGDMTADDVDFVLDAFSDAAEETGFHQGRAS